MKIIGIIPARYASTRLPAKPLQLIKGKSMINRVYLQAQKSKLLSGVYVATDHPEIFEHVKSFTPNVFMTSEAHENGTERCHEVLTLLKDKPDFIINIQGDEPFIEPNLIDDLASALNNEVEIATAIHKITDSADIGNPNVVKCVSSLKNHALYFSRAPIPFARDSDFAGNYFKHIGIYAFNALLLGDLVKLPVSVLEKTEKLEQLRWLENGYTIKTITTKYTSQGIDTPEDLKKVNF